LDPNHNFERCIACAPINLRSIRKVGAALLLVLCLGNSARTEEQNTTQRFLLLSTLRTSTIQKELKQAAASGYRILFAPNESSGSDAGAGLPQAFTEHNQVVLEKTANGAESVEYLFLKSRGQPENSLAFLESDMNEAAAKGYRYRPRTILGLMEKQGGADSPPVKYRIVSGSSKHLQEETCKTNKEGFKFVDLLGGVVVMEKSLGETGDTASNAQAQAGGGGACSYLVIGTRTEGALRKEIAAGATNGYRVVAASCPGEIVVVMEKGIQDARSREYLILDSMRISKLERDMAEAASRGFGAVPRTFLAYSMTNVAIMEKSVSTNGASEYKLLDAQKSATLQKKLSEAAEQGFRPIGMNGARTILVEKAHP
jgi:hypothetical protein